MTYICMYISTLAIPNGGIMLGHSFFWLCRCNYLPVGDLIIYKQTTKFYTPSCIWQNLKEIYALHKLQLCSNLRDVMFTHLKNIFHLLLFSAFNLLVNTAQHYAQAQYFLRTSLCALS
jgi:hypothetical protein